ncbi:MAG: hypothetical protein KDA24_28760 [Deltaproteobacteria bacterium]|nr:hypothetical protein [Deltaproteobacteria bacterium]
MRLIGLFALLVLMSGCPKEATPVTSGTVEVDSREAALGLNVRERTDLRGRLDRQLAVARTADDSDGEIARIKGTLRLLDTLDGIASSARGERDKERDALAAVTAWLDDRVRAGAPPRPEAAPPDPGPWGRALEAEAAGDLETALDEGLLALRQLVDAGVDSASLRFQLAEWAAERGDGALAAELFDGAATVESGQAWIAEEAPLAATRARNLSLGPDGAALAEARTLVDQDRLGDAWLLLEELVATGSDADVLSAARALTEQVRSDAGEAAVHSLARAAQILEGPGPYDEVQRLLEEVAGLPEGTWDEAEHLRLRGWYRNRAGALTEAERQAQDAKQASTLQDARDLVVAGEYRAALKAFAKLEGTALQSAARKGAREASETLVRQERERAGGLFVAARKLRDPAEKRVALTEVQQILQGLIDEFPDSSYVDRLRTNLTAVESELQAI